MITLSRRLFHSVPAFCRLAPLVALFFAAHLSASQTTVGLFSEHTDIGKRPIRSGKVIYNEATDTYTRQRWRSEHMGQD